MARCHTQYTALSSFRVPDLRHGLMPSGRRPLADLFAFLTTSDSEAAQIQPATSLLIATADLGSTRRAFKISKLELKVLFKS